MPSLAPNAAREFYRCMRQPPVVMTAIEARSWAVLPPVTHPLSGLMHEPLTWQEGTGSFLGEYRLLLEVTLDEDERKLLAVVVQPFDGMLAAGCRIPAGSGTAAFSTAAPPKAPNERSSSGNTNFEEWLREAFGCYRTWGCWEGRTPVQRLSARLCVQWQDRVVCLGVTPGMYCGNGHVDECGILFQWHMPAIALPDIILEEVQGSDEDWRLQCISPMLFVNVKPCNAARDTWKADSFELAIEPQLLPPARINDEEEPEEEEFNYDGFEQDCESDMMSLCFMHEAMAMSRTDRRRSDEPLSEAYLRLAIAEQSA